MVDVRGSTGRADGMASPASSVADVRAAEAAEADGAAAAMPPPVTQISLGGLGRVVKTACVALSRVAPQSLDLTSVATDPLPTLGSALGPRLSSAAFSFLAFECC